MGLKMIPWCLKLVGGSTRSVSSRTAPSPAADGVRVIGWDGRVRVYNRPVAAGDLMKEHPCHLVCRSDAFFIGQKVAALASADELRPGQSYFLLPAHFFRSVLSFVTLATSLVAPGKGAGAGGAVQHFNVRKTAAGALQVTLSDEFLRGNKREEESSAGGLVVTTEELEKEYRILVRCKAQKWRPKLETIRESQERSRRGVGPGASKGRERRRAHAVSPIAGDRNKRDAERHQLLCPELTFFPPKILLLVSCIFCNETLI